MGGAARAAPPQVQPRLDLQAAAGCTCRKNRGAFPPDAFRVIYALRRDRHPGARSEQFTTLCLRPYSALSVPAGARDQGAVIHER